MTVTQNNIGSKWPLVVLLVLYVAVIVLATMVIMHRHQSRGLFVQSQKLEKQHDILIAQWSRLKLEQGVVLNEIYVERKAREDLGMRMPVAKDIRMVKE